MNAEETREFWNKLVEELDVGKIMFEYWEKEYWNSFFPYSCLDQKNKKMGRQHSLA